MSGIRSLGRPLRRSSSRVDRSMTHRATARTMAQDPIIIFSMGKTGTSALTHAIVSATDRPIVKTHALSTDGITRRLEKAQRLGINRRPRHLWKSEQISRSLTSPRPWRLLSAVRDPIAIATSDHFYGLSRQIETGQPVWMTGNLQEHAEAIERNLRANFIDRDWFRDELLSATGINVYESPFPTDIGATTLRNANYCALILRAENIADVGSVAVANHFYIPYPLTITHRNRTASSAHSPYDDFLERGRLSPNIVRDVYQTPMARHFYSSEELVAFTQRWTEGEQ